MNHVRLALGLIPGLPLLIGLSACAPKNTEETPAQIVSVRVVRAQQSNESIGVRAPATVFPVEQANVASRLTAPIVEILTPKGSNVTRGQVLARLDNRDLLAQRKEAVALVKDNQASLQKLRTGTVPGDIERAKGQVMTTQAALSQAQKFFERRKQLFDQGAIPNRDLLVSQTDLATAKANAEVAQRALSLLEQQSSGKDIEIAESRLEQAQGRLSVIDTQISFSEIRSPFTGTIVEQFVFAGDMAAPNTPLFTVADLSVTVARGQVPEANAGAIRTGQACRMSPGDQPTSTFEGKVTVVNQAVDPLRRTVEVWCRISNSSGDLRSQVFGSLQVVTGQISNAVVVPSTAIQLEEGTRNGFVMVATAEGKAQKRVVEIGVASGNTVPVLTGLRPGESVIVEGAYGLADGTAIRVTDGVHP